MWTDCYESDLKIDVINGSDYYIYMGPKYNSSVHTTMSRQVLGTKNEAMFVVKKLSKGDEFRFIIIHFKKYNANAKLRSLQYSRYYILCNANAVLLAGWVH